jgi:protein-disulfide isomerase
MPSAMVTDILKPETPTLGDKHAPVLLVEFSDFTCGYCGKFYRETLPLLKSQYFSTGKVRFAYRDYPRDEKGWGLVASHAARCAGEQGHYWDMHDRLFDEAGRLGTGVIMRIAKGLKLNVDSFGTCMDSQRHIKAIIADREEGTNLGFRGTPGFLLVTTDGTRIANPIKIPGAASYAVFEKQIDQLLKKRS